MAHNGKASEDHGYEGIDVMIEIKVKTMDSRTHNLHIRNQRKVRNLKEDIALLIGMPVEQQRLIYCGKFLKDDQLISSYNVQHGDTLHLVCNVPSMSPDGSSSSRLGANHSTDTDGISPGTQQDEDSRLINPGLVNENDNGLHQKLVDMHQLLAEIWRSLYFSSGLRIGEDTAPNTDNEIHDAVDDVSSGPSAAEQTSAHVSADEPASEDVGTSRRRTTDFAESPSPAKQQRYDRWIRPWS